MQHRSDCLSAYLERVLALLNDQSELVRMRTIEAIRGVSEEGRDILVKKDKLHIYVHLLASKLQESSHHLKNGSDCLRNLFNAMKEQNHKNHKIDYQSIGMELLSIIPRIEIEEFLNSVTLCLMSLIDVFREEEFLRRCVDVCIDAFESTMAEKPPNFRMSQTALLTVVHVNPP